jgi:hypothetical protein
MGIKTKINRYIVISILVAGLSAILGVIFYAQSGQLRVVKLNYDETKEKEINKEYDQKILDIYLDPENYKTGFILGNYLKKNPINSAKEFMGN